MSVREILSTVRSEVHAIGLVLSTTSEVFAIASHRACGAQNEMTARSKVATRADAMAAWKQLKRMDAPKNYRAWKKAVSTKERL
jgi:hypothetical protein